MAENRDGTGTMKRVKGKKRKKGRQCVGESRKGEGRKGEDEEVRTERFHISLNPVQQKAEGEKVNKIHSYSVEGSTRFSKKNRNREVVEVVYYGREKGLEGCDLLPN